MAGFRSDAASVVARQCATQGGDGRSGVAWRLSLVDPVVDLLQFGKRVVLGGGIETRFDPPVAGSVYRSRASQRPFDRW
jgi:hypothetical protein